MTESLEKLFHTTQAKEFAKSFKEIEEQYASPQEFLNDAAAYLPVRLYDHYYRDNVPHSLFGLASANLIQNFFSEDDRWRPFAQQTWFATKERKRHPIPLNDIEAKTDGSLEERWEQFEQANDEADFDQALAWAKGFLGREEDRDFFRRQSLACAMEDTFQGGQKFLYLFQMWRLAEALSWKHVDQIICPALHFMVLAPKDHSLSRIVREQWLKNPLKRLLENDGDISNEAFDRAESALLTGQDPTDALSALEELADSGTGLRAIREALLISAGQALCNADSGEWIWPMRAFHLAYALDQLPNGEPQQKTYALMMATGLLNRASLRSRETDGNRQLDDVARRLSPVDPFGVLRSVISHTDPHASATAAYAILAMGEDRREELFQMLCNQAVKNDGEVCYGNDILFLYEAFDRFKDFSLERKEKLPVSAAYFLGRVRKKYDLFGAYGF